MKILQLSDVHFGVEDVDAISAVDHYLVEQTPDAIVVCGDLTQRGKRVEFAAAERWVRSFPCPVMTVPGNHDTPLLNIVERVASPFERYDDYFADLGGPLELGGWRFVGLNTARGWQARKNWAEGVVNLDDLENALDGERKTALICHHPFVPPPETPLRTATRRGKRADARMKSSSAKMLLTGHVHVPTAEFRGEEDNGYVSITAGTLSRRLRDHPPSCNLLTLTADAVSVASLSLENGGFVTSELGKFPMS